MNTLLIFKVVAVLKTNGDLANGNVLQSIATEFVSVVEAFELGLALQSLLETEIEKSSTGLREEEIEEVINYVKENIKQSK
jgi:hypothetical protein